MSNNKIIERIILLRKAKKMTQADLAKQSGVSIQTIRNIEQGKCSPTLDIIERLNQALDNLIY